MRGTKRIKWSLGLGTSGYSGTLDVSADTIDQMIDDLVQQEIAKTIDWTWEEVDQRCRNCEYYYRYEGVCTNGDSEHVADFMSGENVCKEWREISGRRLD